MKLPPRIEMTITRADFRRLLPAAVDYVSYKEDDTGFAYREGGRGWRIGFASLPPLQIGSVRLERHRVDFEFTGHSTGEIEEFMARFERYFRRGGG